MCSDYANMLVSDAAGVVEGWRALLKHIMLVDEPLDFDIISKIDFRGLQDEHLVSLSKALWDLMGNSVADNTIEDLEAFVGDGEENGFDVFRTLYWDNMGGAQQAQVSNIRPSIDFPNAIMKPTFFGTCRNGFSSRRSMATASTTRTSSN